ncbi:DUF1427 family protein [Fictibacillus sp. WQ 8-8]|uniref:XapX domain-containing protein n=1 Tax=Fictibacillus sp. WQ 8-8 TaxID=2938788 RepID=UPI0009E964C7|nr:DUF1427 family protein [Fictibacillus sp. WQ 8-8]MCQ6268116.1 DUF1427 family protein [Fictibacillus sp. WQ 8-8]
MKELILSLVSGIIVGVIFKLIRLPIPAPPVLSGVIGIVGVWLGASLISLVLDKVQG